MDKGSAYTYRSNESSSKGLDELKFRYLKEITYYPRRGCYMASDEYKIIYGNK